MNNSIGLVADAVSVKGENYSHTKRMERVIYNYNEKGMILMRKIIDFNRKWAFTKMADVVPETMPTKWDIVNLPHSWNAIDGQDGDNDYYRGTCYYAKQFAKASLPEADRYFLEINGANRWISIRGLWISVPEAMLLYIPLFGAALYSFRDVTRIFGFLQQAYILSFARNSCASYFVDTLFACGIFAAACSCNNLCAFVYRHKALRLIMA